MSEFTVCIPSHSPHFRCWEELATSVHWALSELGHTAYRDSNPRPRTRAIYLGWPLNKPDSDAIFYNTEQVSKDSYWQHNALYAYYKGRTVWDYSAANAARFGQYNLPAPSVVRPGYCPLLEDRFTVNTKTYDVAFFGSSNERREQVLREVEAKGLKLLRVPFGLYGKDRDTFLAQARLCLNVHFYESAIFESVRCSYLALNRMPVLSELSAGEESSAYGIDGFAYEKLAAVAAGLIHSTSALEELTTIQHASVRSVSMVDDLGRALEQLAATDVSRVQVSVPASMPELTLCMIVKDEIDVIERCLASVKPYIKRWSILDTGSTDGTQIVIRDFMSDVPGKLHERPWKGFDGSRTEAIDLARQDCANRGWLLMLDADETLEIDSDLVLPDDYDCYNSWISRCREGCLRWGRFTFMRANKPWAYEMPVHELLYCREHAPSRAEPIPNSFILSTWEGARSKENPYDRYMRDARVLEEWILKHPGHTRCQYYIAQSYRDAATAKNPIDRSVMQKAMLAYMKRANMPGGFTEETFSALYEAAKAQAQCGYPWDKVMQTMLLAFNERPTRAEPLYLIARHFREEKKYALAEIFARRAASLPMSTDSYPGVEHAYYVWQAKEELSVSLTWLGEYEEALALNLEIYPHLPDHERPRVDGNIETCRRMLGISQ